MNIFWVFTVYFALYLVSWEVLCVLILRITLGSKYNYLHFTDEEMETQKSSVIYSDHSVCKVVVLQIQTSQPAFKTVFILGKAYI